MGRGADDDCSPTTMKWSCCCFITILSVILFAVSFDTLAPDEMGILYNNIYKTIDESKVYTEGRHFLGLGNSYIKYPRSVILIDFKSGKSLNIFTREGQGMTVDVSVLYRRDPSRLLEVYKNFTENLDFHHKFLVGIAEATIKGVTPTYTAMQFFKERKAISSTIKSKLGAIFSAYGAELHSVQLRKVVIPTVFEDVVTSKTVAAQQEILEGFTRNVTLTKASTEIIKALAQADIKLIQANAAATAKLIKVKAEADGFLEVQTSAASAYDAIAAEFTLLPEDMSYFAWSKSFQNKNSGNLMIGLDGSGLKTNPQPNQIEEQQLISVPTTGEAVVCKFGGQTMGGTFAGNANAAAVKTALEGLSSVGEVQVSAATRTGLGNVYTVIFLTNKGNLPLMHCYKQGDTSTSYATEHIAGTGPGNFVYTFQ